MEERIVGMIVGAAVGDALGSPVEFMSRQQITIKHGRVVDMIGGGWLGLRPGQWTDDTAMMLCLIESLLEREEFDQNAVASKYLAWFRTRPISIGNAVHAALSVADSEGLPPEEAAMKAYEGAGEVEADNDTVMRCCPLAARYYDNPPKLIETSYREARITHWDLRAASGSALLNLILSGLLRGLKKSEAFAAASESLNDNPYGLYAIVPDVTLLSEDELKPGARVEDTLASAFWYFRHSPNFEQTLIQAVNRGGEAGTIGTVSGALAGARYGYESIPKRWTNLLQDHGKIYSLARRLADLALKHKGK